MKIIPSGNIAFLFTDIEGSTKLSQEFPDTIHSELEKHHSIMKRAIESNRGFIFEIIGDGFCSAFENAGNAVRAAVAAQLELACEKWNDVKIKVRMGIHSGDVEWNGNNYIGYITLASTARITSAAYGEQILISKNAFDLFNLDNTFRDKISFRDLGERRLKDLINPIRVYQVLSDGLRKDFPPLKTPDARPSNLPVQLTGFIGRIEEIEQIKNLLLRSHLITITGMGGTGKTRLALQVGFDVIDHFENGVWLAELAALSETSLLAETIIKIFGLMEEPNKSQEDTLCDFLKNKELLLILDNCEHLVHTCADLAEKLLISCPRLRIITTSREALKCRGEQLFPVVGMSVPPNVEMTPEKIIEYESIKLFIGRATSVNPKFSISNDNVAAIAGICSQLDGVPLAIELAAAKIRFLSVEKIYERLDDRFNLLTKGNRTSLPRQQTLRALIDWSYDLLSEQERILWRRTTVFNGGWTLDAAEVICPDVISEKRDVLDLLSQLIEKSIVIFDEDKERYNMTETIRQYGEEKFAESENREITEKKYLKYYMDLAETAAPKLRSSEMEIWMRKLDVENGNLKKSLHLSLEYGEYENGIRLVGALVNFWTAQGLFSSGVHLLNIFLEKAAGVPDSLRAKALYISGMLLMLHGEFEKSRKHTEDSLKIYRRTEDKKGIALCLNILASDASEQGRYEDATRLYEESLLIRRESGDERGVILTLNNLGNVKFNQGEFRTAKKFIEESLEYYRNAGDKRIIANTLANLANVLCGLEENENATKLIEEALQMQRETGDKKAVANSLLNLGDLSLNNGEYENARKYLEESLAIFEEIEDRAGIAFSLCELGYLGIAKGDFEKSLEYIEKSLSIRIDIGDKRGSADCYENLGKLHAATKKFNEAAAFYEKNLILRYEVGNNEFIAKALSKMGGTMLQLHDNEKAKKHYLESLGISLESDNKRQVINTIFEAVEIILSFDNYKHAAMLIGSIEQLYSAYKAESKSRESIKFEKINSELKEKLSNEEYLKYFSEGNKMTVSESLKRALSEQ